MDLPTPFFVLATQNPIEQEGTYPLPEAQLDRFMLKISLDYPDGREEVEVLRATTGGAPDAVQPVLSGQEILELQNLVRGIAVSDAILEYTALLVRSSRPGRGRGDQPPGEEPAVHPELRGGIEGRGNGGPRNQANAERGGLCNQGTGGEGGEV